MAVLVVDVQINRAIRSAESRIVPAHFALGAAALLALALLAFWPMYLSRPFATSDYYTHLHAFAGLVWLLTLLAQPLLIRGGRRNLHRALGKLSYVTAPLFVASSLFLAHYRFSRMDAASFESEAYTLYLPVSAAFLFAASYAMALVHRRNAQLHARFMACTALLLLDPVLGRVLGFYAIDLPQFWQYQLITFTTVAVLLLLLARTLPRRSADARRFALFAAAYGFVLALWFVAPRTEGWMWFARWFRQVAVT